MRCSCLVISHHEYCRFFVMFSLTYRSRILQNMRMTCLRSCLELISVYWNSESRFMFYLFICFINSPVLHYVSLTEVGCLWFETHYCVTFVCWCLLMLYLTSRAWWLSDSELPLPLLCSWRRPLIGKVGLLSTLRAAKGERWERGHGSILYIAHCCCTLPWESLPLLVARV